MHCCFTVHRIFQEHNTRRQPLLLIYLDAQNFSTNCPFSHEGPAGNVLPLHRPSSEENSNPSVIRINGYHKQQNEKRWSNWCTIYWCITCFITGQYIMLIMGTTQHSMNQSATEYHNIAILLCNKQMCHSANE